MGPAKRSLYQNLGRSFKVLSADPEEPKRGLIKPMSKSFHGNRFHFTHYIPHHTGFDSPGGDLFKLHCDTNSGMPAMAQLLGAADKVMILIGCFYRMK